jgi:sec-independent protein translocase protein TatB
VFDIAFSELIVIAVVALIVIGPEKLPKVARTLGAITGRMQKYMTQIKDEVNREARFADLQKLQNEIQSTATAHQVALQSGINEIAQDVQSTAVQNNIVVEPEARDATRADKDSPQDNLAK